MIQLIVFVLICFGSQSSFGETFSPALSQAQQAYLNRDAATLVSKAKEALQAHQNHPLIVAHVSGVLEAATRNGVLNETPVDWRLPKAVEWLNVSVNRRYFSDSGRVSFFISASGLVDKSSSFEQFQIIRYPEKVIVDRKAKVGEWYEETYDGKPMFYVGAQRSPLPVEEGLYLLNIKLTGQEMVQGWFILSDVNSSASPVVSAPKVAQSYQTSQPTFEWKNFHSPEWKAKEARHVTVKVVRKLSNDEEKDVMEADLDANITKFRVGDKGSASEYSGASELEQGDYAMTLIYRERRMFGEVAVSRQSSTKVRFTVRR